MDATGTRNGGVLVIGPGAIGTWTAAHAALAGRPVVVACRNKDAAAAIHTSGLAVQDQDGPVRRAAVATVHRPKDLPWQPSVVVLATKCADALPAWQTWQDVIGFTAPVVALQNGLMGDVLAPHMGGRLVLGTVTFPATLTGPGASQRTGPGGYLLGSWPPRARPDPGEQQVQQALAHAGPADLAVDIQGVQWTKLLVNSCITSLGAIAGRPLGELLRHPAARGAFLDIVTEGYQAGLAEGVDFQKVHGFHPRRFADRRDGQGRRLRHGLLRIVAAKYRRHRSSSLQSLERGRQTEVDFLNGAITAAAWRQGLEAPVNERVVSLVHSIEAGHERPAPHLLDALRT